MESVSDMKLRADVRSTRGSKHRGFTLIELAVVIAIVGLLLGGVLTPLATQLEARKTRETERLMREIKQALIGFAIVNGKLPCPDTLDPTETGGASLDGLEDCGFDQGFVPWATLDIRTTDAWGHLIAYRVTQEFTSAAVSGAECGANRLDQCDIGDIVVYTRGDDPLAGGGGETKEQLNLASTAVAVLVSYGANAVSARALDGTERILPAATTPATGADELENSARGIGDGDVTFASRLHTPGGANCDDAVEAEVFCEYDDLTLWLSRSVLIGELFNAGVLP